MEQLLINFELPSELTISQQKIPDILNKCLEIYNESLNLKNKEYYSDSMYNMILALNILNYLKKNTITKLDSHITPLINSASERIIKNIN